MGRFFIVPTGYDAWLNKLDALSEVGALLVDVDSESGCTLDQLRALIASSIPVLAITEAGSSMNRAVCLELGAMDAISRPIQTCELRARLARFSRPSEHQGLSLHFAGWALLPVERRLFSPSGRRVDLTEGMTRLLCCFFERPEQPLMVNELSALSGRRGADRGAIRALVSRTIRRIESQADDPAPISRAPGGWILTRAEPNRARGRFRHALPAPSAVPKILAASHVSPKKAKADLLEISSEPAAAFEFDYP